MFLKTITDIGVTNGLSAESIKRTRIINQISVLTISMGLGILLYGIILEMPPLGIAVALGITATMVTPLLLNASGRILSARLFFLCISYCFIMAIAILFGEGFHFQYFLIGGIGMPLIFLNDEVGKLKWLLVVIAIPLWMYLEWHYTQFEPIIFMKPEAVEWMRLVNDFLIFITVGSSFYIFVSQNQKQILEIEKQQAELEVLNHDLDQFTKIAAHDLKSPLANVTMLADAIEADGLGGLNSTQREYFKLIKTCSSDMRELVDGILKYSRAGSDAVDIQRFNLWEIVDYLPRMTSIPTRIEIKTARIDQWIHGSPLHMRQVLTNLVCNAVKHHHPEGGNIWIRAYELPNKMLRVSVSDNGPGIPESELPHIFDMYKTVSHPTSTDSTGVGLAIVQKLVKKHGGKVGVASTVGQGSDFWFTWPQDHRES